MKKRYLCASLLAIFSMAVEANAERKYGRAGCGLGSLIMKPNSSQSSAATTNGTMGSQTFGITSGTSNCTPGSAREAAEIDLETFFVANFATLSKEIAQGEGETISGFAGALGCRGNSVADLAAHLKANHSEIFASPGALAALETAREDLRDAPELVENCLYL